jgi:hypothetical protein
MTPKIPFWENFVGPLEFIMLVCFIAIWYILVLFGTFDCHLVYFCHFGYIVPIKIWQSWSLIQKEKTFFRSLKCGKNVCFFVSFFCLPFLFTFSFKEWKILLPHDRNKSIFCQCCLCMYRHREICTLKCRAQISQIVFGIQASFCCLISISAEAH